MVICKDPSERDHAINTPTEIFDISRDIQSPQALPNKDTSSFYGVHILFVPSKFVVPLTIICISDLENPSREYNTKQQNLLSLDLA
jgi:hypothetical protein